MGGTDTARRVDTREGPSHDSDVGDGRHADAVLEARFGEEASAFVLRRARLSIA